MLKVMCVLCACFAIFPLCAKGQAKYEIATIMDVNVHKDAPSDVVSYDVSVKVGKTTYVVLFTPPLGENDVKYVAGRELLVLVGEKSIKYNDMLGRSLEVPILSQRSADRETKQTSASYFFNGRSSLEFECQFVARHPRLGNHQSCGTHS